MKISLGRTPSLVSARPRRPPRPVRSGSRLCAAFFFPRFRFSVACPPLLSLLGLAPKIGCSGWKRRLQTVTYTPNLVDRDPEGVFSRLRCICAWGGAPSPLAPRSRGHPLKKSTKTHTRALCNRGRRTHLRVAALPAASRASICSFASCPLDAVSSGAAAAAHC